MANKYDDNPENYEVQERMAILEECLDEIVERVKADDPGIHPVHAKNRALKQIREQAAAEVAARER